MYDTMLWDCAAMVGDWTGSSGEFMEVLIWLRGGPTNLNGGGSKAVSGGYKWPALSTPTFEDGCDAGRARRWRDEEKETDKGQNYQISGNVGIMSVSGCFEGGGPVEGRHWSDDGSWRWLLKNDSSIRC